MAVTYTLNGAVANPTTAGSYAVDASLNNPDYQATDAIGTLVISPATPHLTWANPADIVYGTKLGSTQLDAMASVPGTFAYTPAAGTVLQVGQGQTLSALFTPTDMTDYLSVTAQAVLNVAPAPLTVTAVNETQVYGAALSALTYTYTGLVNGDTSATFSGGLATTATSSSSVGGYPITQGTLAATGNYTIGTFNPGTLIITQATPTITWANPANIVYGTALSATQLDATASWTVGGNTVNVPGSLHLQPGRRHRPERGQQSDPLGVLHTHRHVRLHQRLGHGLDQRRPARHKHHPGRLDTRGRTGPIRHLHRYCRRWTTVAIPAHRLGAVPD